MICLNCNKLCRENNILKLHVCKMCGIEYNCQFGKDMSDITYIYFLDDLHVNYVKLIFIPQLNIITKDHNINGTKLADSIDLNKFLQKLKTWVIFK